MRAPVNIFSNENELMFQFRFFLIGSIHSCYEKEQSWCLRFTQEWAGVRLSTQCRAHGHDVRWHHRPCDGDGGHGPEGRHRIGSRQVKSFFGIRSQNEICFFGDERPVPPKIVEKKRASHEGGLFNGGPYRIRTGGQRIKSPLLYRAELTALSLSISARF